MLESTSQKTTLDWRLHTYAWRWKSWSRFSNLHRIVKMFLVGENNAVMSLFFKFVLKTYYYASPNQNIQDKLGTYFYENSWDNSFIFRSIREPNKVLVVCVFLICLRVRSMVHMLCRGSAKYCLQNFLNLDFLYSHANGRGSPMLIHSLLHVAIRNSNVLLDSEMGDLFISINCEFSGAICEQWLYGKDTKMELDVCCALNLGALVNVEGIACGAWKTFPIFLFPWFYKYITASEDKQFFFGWINPVERWDPQPSRSSS